MLCDAVRGTVLAARAARRAGYPIAAQILRDEAVCQVERLCDPPDPGPDDGTGLGDRDSEGDDADYRLLLTMMSTCEVCLTRRGLAYDQGKPVCDVCFRARRLAARQGGAA